MNNYPWYNIIENSDDLEQGDFVPECPIVKPPEIITEGVEVNIEIELIDSIILSQSCDLKNAKVSITLVCPYISLKEFINQLPEDNRKTVKAKTKTTENLRKGIFPGYHLLNKPSHADWEDFIVVDFKNVYGIHVENLKQVAGKLEKRLRLLSPYKEHLSQSFARYFMRVGLPQDIIIGSDYIKNL
jgi:hypothetical protein